jgi:hypothetical protein
MPVASRTVSDGKLTLPINLSSRRAALPDCCGVRQTHITGTPAKRTGSNSSRTKGRGRAQTERQRARRCDRRARTKNNSPRILDEEIARTGNLPKKLLINSPNPEPYSFVKLALFIEGYFNSQLKTFSNIHYLLMSILTHNSQLLTRVPDALQLS